MTQQQAKPDDRQGLTRGQDNDVICVVTPCYNAVDYIDSTILSVVTQEGPFTIRYHVQDGGSTDGTVEKLRSWQAGLESPENLLVRCRQVSFTWASETDNGMYDAINRGFATFDGDRNAICTWINSDDVIPGGALAAVRRIFLDNPDAAWLTGAINSCGTDQEEVSQYDAQFPVEIIREGLCDNQHWRFMQQEGTYWRRALWNRVDGVDAQLKYCGDWDLWRRFAAHAGPLNVVWPLGRFRIHGNQLTSGAIDRYYLEMDGIVPMSVRKESAEKLLDREIAPIRTVTRPYRPDASLQSKDVALSLKAANLLQEDRNRKWLTDYVRKHDTKLMERHMSDRISKLKRVLKNELRCQLRNVSSAVYTVRAAVGQVRRRNRRDPGDHHMRLLRNEYATNRSRIVKLYRKVKRRKRLHDSESATYKYRLDVVEGSRIRLHWGDGRIQLLPWSDWTEPHVNMTQQQAKPDDRQGLTRGQDNDVICVVTPCYNAVDYIDSTILSVVTQEGPFTIRYHVQDGGSTDGTVEKLRSWQAGLESPENLLVRCRQVSFTWASETDNGMYDAINRGFATFGGDRNAICTWINSDDVIPGGALAAVRRIFLDNPDAAWLTGAINSCGTDQEEVSQYDAQFPVEIIREGLCDNRHWRFMQQEGTYWRRALWNRVDGVDAQLKYCGDWDLWRRFAAHADPLNVVWPLGRFRIHGNQLTSGAIDRYYLEMDGIVPMSVRKESAEKLLDREIAPIRTVTRPYRPDASLQSKDVALSLKAANLLQEDRNRKWLTDYVRKHDTDRLKVLTLCTIAHGGAGTGTIRRIDALRKIGVDAKLVSLYSNRKDGHIARLEPVLDALDTRKQQDVWRYIISNLKNEIMEQPYFLGQEFFSLTDSVIDMRQLKNLVDRFDVIHLHWVVGMLDLENIAEVIGNKPLIWTTADMNSFTGGCHYSEGCEEFTRECAVCSMLQGENDIPHRAWLKKKEAYAGLDITLVCPSEYIARLARKSSLLGDKRIRVIPNAYPVDVFKPKPRAVARKRFKLPQDRKLVMFGSEALDNVRKGGDIYYTLAKMIRRYSRHRNVEFVSIGRGALDLPVRVHNLGSLNETSLAQAYSAADVFVSLSREDVGPMTVVESLLCGTPVVGFSIGLLPDVVIQGLTGVSVEPYNIRKMVDAVDDMLDASSDRAILARACRESALRYADPVQCARRHVELYRSLLPS